MRRDRLTWQDAGLLFSDYAKFGCYGLDAKLVGFVEPSREGINIKQTGLLSGIDALTRKGRAAV